MKSLLGVTGFIEINRDYPTQSALIVTKRLCCDNVHGDILLCGYFGLNRFFVFNFSEGVPHLNKGIGDAGSTADFRMLWSAIVCLGLL